MNNASLKLLLIEDNAPDALLLRATLEDVAPSATLLTADRLATGLKVLATEEDIDLLLLDLSLPDSRGIDTVRRVCAAAPDLPILVLSGLADETVAIEAVRAGAQGYLVKWRFGADVMMQTMALAIEQKRRLVSLERRAREFESTAALLREVTDHISDGLVVVDHEGIIRFVNPAAEALFGLRRDQLVGQVFGAPPVTSTSTELCILGRQGNHRVVEARAVKTQYEGRSACLLVLHS